MYQSKTGKMITKRASYTLDYLLRKWHNLKSLCYKKMKKKMLLKTIPIDKERHNYHLLFHFVMVIRRLGFPQHTSERW